MTPKWGTTRERERASLSKSFTGVIKVPLFFFFDGFKRDEWVGREIGKPFGGGGRFRADGLTGLRVHERYVKSVVYYRVVILLIQ